MAGGSGLGGINTGYNRGVVGGLLHEINRLIVDYGVDLLPCNKRVNFVLELYQESFKSRPEFATMNAWQFICWYFAYLVGDYYRVNKRTESANWKRLTGACVSYILQKLKDQGCSIEDEYKLRFVKTLRNGVRDGREETDLAVELYGLVQEKTLAMDRVQVGEPCEVDDEIAGKTTWGDF